MNAPPHNFMELMKRIHDALEKKANHNLLRYGITASQLHMLMALGYGLEQGAQAVKLKDLERCFGVAQSTAAGIAARLEKRGLISSFTDDGDKRVKLLQITPAGQEICRAAKESVEDTHRRFLSCLTPQEEEELTRLLKKVYRAVKS